MMASLQRFANRALGRGESAIAVPTFDGALKPNQHLEEAETLLECEAPNDLTTDGTALYLADGPRLLKLEPGGASEVRSFDRPISAISCLPGGRFAVALAGREVRLYDAPGAEHASAALATGLRAVNALAPGPGEDVIATDGCSARGPDEWAWDLLEGGHSGRLLLLHGATASPRVLAGGLAYAFGALAAGDEVLVSESWKHRLVAIGRNGAPRIVLPHLPVYPSRLSPAADGGYWLTAFIARSLLIEFVLREPAYRKRMMAEIDPEYWVVPRLRSGLSFKEPLQGAHIKTMGVIKPWAPPRSYGLIIRLDSKGAPLYSLHSRVDGRNHGVTAAVEFGDSLIAIAKGPGRVLRLSLARLEKELGA